MEHRALVSARMPVADCEEALRAWYLGRGWRVREEGESRLEFSRPFRIKGLVGWRIEDLAAALEVRWARREGNERAEVMISVEYRVDARFRLWSHLDHLYFQLEVEALGHYLRTGRRLDPTIELDRVRRPVAVAVMLNVVTAAALTTAAAIVIDLGLVAAMLISFGVALINFVSILGFADLVVSGMDDLARFRTRLDRDSDGQRD